MMTYRVNCYREGVLASHGVSEWYPTLASALSAFLVHQQCRWNSVALVPQARLSRQEYQRRLAEQEEV
jgi:hypothetical protein